MSDRKESGEDAELARISAEVASEAVGASVGLVLAGPPGAILGAVIPPLAMRAIDAIRTRYSERQQRRVAYVLAVAADRAGVEVDRFVEVLEGDPGREELLVRTLRAAQDSALTEKLVAFAVSLASGYESGDLGEVSWEAQFVRALEDCDEIHLRILSLFSKAANELELGSGSEDFDEVVSGLNRNQLEMVVPELATLLDSALSTLERHGLVRGATATSGLTFRINTDNILWKVTAFGEEFLRRMRVVYESLALARNPDN